MDLISLISIVAAFLAIKWLITWFAIGHFRTMQFPSFIDIFQTTTLGFEIDITIIGFVLFMTVPIHGVIFLAIAGSLIGMTFFAYGAIMTNATLSGPAPELEFEKEELKE